MNEVKRALLAAMVAKSALDFCNSTASSTVLKLQFKQLIDDVEKLRQQIAADVKGEQP